MMKRWRAGWVMSYRGISCSPCEQDCFQSKRNNLSKWVDPAECCAKNCKTWHDIEVQYITTLSRCSSTSAPERRYFNIDKEDLFICRRGCLHSCPCPPPCFDPVYPSPLEKILYTLGNWTAIAIVLALVYGTVQLHVWGPSGPLLDTVLGVQQPESLDKVAPAAVKLWNSVFANLFSGLKFIFPPKERADPMNMQEFIVNIEDAVRDKKYEESQTFTKDPLEDDTFEEWECIYKYVPKRAPLKVEAIDDVDWMWMDHDDRGSITESNVPLPFEQASRKTMIRASKGASMAAAYTDFPSQIVNEDSIEEVPRECNSQSLENYCKRKLMRRRNVKINPDQCKICQENPQDPSNQK